MLNRNLSVSTWKLAVKQLRSVVIGACIGISEVEATDQKYSDTRYRVPSVDC